MISSNDAWADIPTRLALLPPPRIPSREFLLDVSNASKEVARRVLQNAINDCHQCGGGRVVVPAGEYSINGPLTLRSSVDLHLSEGALLRFSGEPADFMPPVLQRWEGTEVFSHSPLITADHAHDIAITGRGTIDGQGKRIFESWQPIQKQDQSRLRDMGRDGVPLEKRIFGKETRLRPSLFQPINCERVLLEGVTIRDSPFWTIHPTYCRHVIIRGVTVDSMNFNNDGCDPDSCSDVLIENCIFRTGDDGIAIKSGRDQDAWRVARPTERVLVRNCEFFSKINGLCIGSEMSGGVRHIFMENCRIAEAASVLYLKSNADRGGVVEQIFMRNIAIDRSKVAVVRLESNYHSHRGGNFPSHFRGIDIRDVHCRSADSYGLFLEGSPSCPVSDLTITNLTIDYAREPVFLRHANLLSENVVIGSVNLPPNPPQTPVDNPRLKLTM